MKNTSGRRRVLSWLLALVMVLSLFPTAALAAEGEGAAPAAACSCTVLCTAEDPNPDCPVCAAEGADLSECMRKAEEEPPAEEAVEEPATQKLVTAFGSVDDALYAEDLDGDPMTAAFEVEAGTPESALGLPGELAATVDGGEANVAVTWASAPAYDPETEGEYVFTAAPADDTYALAEGLELPTVVVTVSDKLSQNNPGLYTTYTDAKITQLTRNSSGLITSTTVSFSTTDTIQNSKWFLAFHPNAPSGTISGSSSSDVSGFSSYPHSSPEATSNGAHTMTISASYGVSATYTVGLWIYYNGSWTCDKSWSLNALVNEWDQTQGFNVVLTNPTESHISTSGGSLTQTGINASNTFQSIILTAGTGYSLTAETIAAINRSLTGTGLAAALSNNGTITISGTPTKSVSGVTLPAASPAGQYVASAGNDTTGDGTQEKPYATIGKAYDTAVDGTTIHVMDGVTVNTTNTLSGDKTVTITGDGTGSLKRGNAEAVLVDVGKGSVTLKNITLNGNSESMEATSPLTRVSGGTLTIGSGAVLEKNKNINQNGGQGGSAASERWAGGVMVSGGTAVIADGAVIRNNESMYGGAIHVNHSGNVTLSGGTITGNKTTRPGGAAVSVLDNSNWITVSGKPAVTGNVDSIGNPGNVQVLNPIKIARGGLAEGAKIGVSTSTAPSDTADVQFAAADSNASADDVKNAAKYFQSDSASTAGVLYCDGTNDTPVAGHHTSHAEKTLWLSTVARTITELYVNTAYTGGDGNGTYAKPYTTLQAAYAAAPILTREPIEIRLLSDVTLDTAVTFGTAGNGSALKNLIVTSYTDESTEATDGGWAIKRGGGLTGDNCLAVKSYDKIEFRHVTLDGANLAATASFLTVSSGGKATLGAGVKAAHHQITGDAVYLLSVLGGGSVLTLDGAEVTGNAVTGTGTIDGPSAVLGAGSTGNLTIKGDTDIHGNTVSASASVVTIGLYKNPVFQMEGGKIRNNTLNGIAPAAVYMRGAATDAHLYFSGSPFVYDNVTASGEQKNVYLKNGTADAYLELTGALTGGKIGVYAETMPSAGRKTVPVAIGSGEYTATAGDAGCFKSDKETTAGISFADSTHTVVLDYDARSASGGVDKNGGGYVSVDVSAGTGYAVLDENGAAIPGLKAYDKNGIELMGTNGWYTTANGPIIFKPVLAGSHPMVVSNPMTTAEATAPTDKKDSGTGVSVPAVSDKQLSAEIKDGNPKTATITISPASPDLVYGLVDSNGQAVTPLGDWKGPDATGKVEFPGLTPGGDYKVVAKPATGDDSTTADKAGTGVGVKTPADTFENVASGDVTRTESDSAGQDKIVISPTKAGQEYGIYDPETGTTEWKTSQSGEDITFDSLSPDKDYEVLTRTPAGTNPVTPPSLPGKGVSVPAGSVRPGDVSSGGTGADGKGSISVNNTSPDNKYAVVDQATGKVVAPVGGDKDGWLTGNGGKLDFPGLTPGGDYKVVSVPKDGTQDQDGTTPGGNTLDNSPYPSEPGNVAGPVVSVPAVSADQLTGGYVKGDPSPANDKATVTVDPSAQDVQYAVVKPDGTIAAIQTGNGGKLTFEGLTPGTDYKVVVIPDGTQVADGSGGKRPIAAGDKVDDAVKADGASVKDKINDSAVGIVTPVAPVDPGKITRGPDDNGQGNDSREDKITIADTDSSLEFAIVDKDTGKVVAPIGSDPDGWLPGNGGELSFNDLDPNKSYEVVVRKPGVNGAVSVPATGVDVGKRGALEAKGKVVDASGDPVADATVKVTVATTDGGYTTIETTTGPDGSYTLSGTNVQTPAKYAVFVDGGAKGRETKEITFTQGESTLPDITADASTHSIAGGAVGDYGKPMVGADVKIRDKATGALVPTDGKPAGSTLTTTPGGGYVVEGLPDGTYIVETSGSGKSGMTEIVVKNGTATPNKDGGYKDMDLAATPGGILSGKVTGLASGEKATVSMNIPVYDENGTVIGSKTVTAQATGPNGFYQIAGVPDGKYPVTVTTPKGAVTGDATISSGSVTAVAPGEGMTETGLKAENGQLNAAAPSAKPENPNAITGAVVDEAGKPVKGAAIDIYNEKGEKVGEATTGDGGGYTVPNKLPDGKYYISADAGGKNGLTGPIEIKNGETVGKTTVSVSKDASKLLEGTVTTSGGAPASNATVVVKDSAGNPIATTKTNGSGQYFVGSVPADATVSIVSSNGETAEFTVSGAGASWDGTKQLSKPGADTLSVIGPDGSVLPVAKTESDKNAKISAKDSGGADKTDSFTVEDGVFKAKATTPDGTYTVTVEKDGMKVEKQITVSGGKITGGSPFEITSAKVTGTLQYANGSKPIDATVSVPGWGSAKVNSNTGKYELPNMPDGTYTAKITVTDGNTSSTITVPLVVKNGQATYGSPVQGDATTGAIANASGTDLTVGPTNAVKGVQNQIDAAKAAVADAKANPNDAGKNAAAIQKVKDAMSGIGGLTEEGLRQISPNAAKELASALDDLLGASLSFKTPTASGVKNPNEVVSAIQGQQGMLVTGEELEAAADPDTTVDVSLALKVTEGETSNVKKDLPKVDTLATQAGATDKAVFEIVVEKTTEVKENTVPISKETTTVSTLPVPVQITLDIPADLQGFDYYSVVRVHGGTAQRIPSTATKTQVTFSSNLYSTYAILASNDPLFQDDETVNPVAPPPPVVPDNPGGNGGGGGGGGGGSSSSDGVNISKSEHGKVTVDKSNASKGQTVTITVTPDKGYELGTLTATDKKGNELRLKDLGNGKFSYTQPESSLQPVTIKATFEKVSGGAPDYASCPKDDTCPLFAFTDAGATAWYHDGVHFCVDNGLMAGTSATTFSPNGTTTRAMIVTILYRLEGEPKTSGGGYPDVAAGQYYTDAVAWAAKNGIVSGYTNGNFGPNDPITREQMAAILYRYAGFKDYDVSAKADLSKFSDSASVSGYAAEPLSWANAEGLVTGKGSGILDPKGNATRAQVATILMRFCETIAEQ